jgi:hypothetical protein
MIVKRDVQETRDLPAYSVSTKHMMSFSLWGKSKKCDMLNATAAVREMRQLAGYKSVEEIRQSQGGRRNSWLRKHINLLENKRMPLPLDGNECIRG